MQDLNHDERIQLARLIMELLDSWGAGPREQIALLALPLGTKPRALSRYRDDTPLPDESGINERVEHLVGIAEALRTAYPLNSAAGGLWMNRPNPWFGERTPLVTMIEDGLDGVCAVRAHVDCAWDWYNDSQRNARQPGP